jgi:hypothetical protein
MSTKVRDIVSSVFLLWCLCLSFELIAFCHHLSCLIWLIFDFTLFSIYFPLFLLYVPSLSLFTINSHLSLSLLLSLLQGSLRLARSTVCQCSLRHLTTKSTASRSSVVVLPIRLYSMCSLLIQNMDACTSAMSIAPTAQGRGSFCLFRTVCSLWRR